MDAYKISFRRLTDSALARNSAIVFAGSMSANVLAYVYHLVMGRLLGPSGYGELSSLLSLLYIFTVPLIVVQTVLVKFISGFKAHGEPGQSKALFVAATKKSVIWSLLGLPFVLFAAPWVKMFLHLSGSTTFVLLYLLLVFSLLSVVAASVLTGYQMFIAVAVMGVLAVALKLIISVPLAAWGVIAVILAAVLASVITYALYFYPIRSILSARAKSTNLKVKEAYNYAVPTFATILGVTSLYSTDIILVRHFFDPQIAGLYAALAVLGKIIFYASSAIVMVLFPVVSERAAIGKDTRKLVRSAVIGVGAISLGLVAAYFLLPGLIVRFLFGNAYTGAASLLGLFGIFIALFSVGNVIVTANLALGKTGIWVVSIWWAFMQIIGISLYHTSLVYVILLNIGITLFFDISAWLYYKRSYEKV